MANTRDRQIEGYTSRRIEEASRVVIEAKIRVISDIKSEGHIYKPLCTILNRVCLDLADPDDERVLVFVENSRKGLKQKMSGTDIEKPDLVGFFVPRDIAIRMVSGVLERGHTDWPEVPPAQGLISVVECKIQTDADNIDQCKCYLFVLSRHRPGSSMQYGFVADNSMIRLIGLGLDEQPMWPEVRWTDSHCVEKLYELVKLVLDEAKKPISPCVPKLYRILGWKNYTIGTYTVTVSDRRFLLLHIFSGKGSGRKTFIALGAERGNPEEARVFKYSWRKDGQHNRERLILEKLADAPGVVRIDSNLSRDSVDTDEATARQRSLLVMKTVCSPLCSSPSVQAFLEAMYDLLEVQEKRILHRDISWGNVLVNPKQNVGRRPQVTVGQDTGEGPPGPVKIDRKGEIRHTYRFVHDLLGEDSDRFRVALADFDHAADLDEDPPENLKDATGTPMFMANDVISPRDYRSLAPLPFLVLEDVQNAALNVCEMKYADDTEKDAWDKFYTEELQQLEWRVMDRAGVSESFRHGAVHDAESVYWFCVLFFCRMLPKGLVMSDEDLEAMKVERGELFTRLRLKTAGDNGPLIGGTVNFFHVGKIDDKLLEIYQSLSTINDYLLVPWYNVSGTGRGERYEFHLHDFMQRLLWNHIARLRDSNDPIPVQPEPLSVKTDVRIAGDATTNCLKGVPSTDDSPGRPSKRIRRGDTDYDKLVPTELDLTEPHPDTIMVDDPEDFVKMHKGYFLREHWDILVWKRRERPWYVADTLYE